MIFRRLRRKMTSSNRSMYSIYPKEQHVQFMYKLEYIRRFQEHQIATFAQRSCFHYDFRNSNVALHRRTVRSSDPKPNFQSPSSVDSIEKHNTGSRCFCHIKINGNETTIIIVSLCCFQLNRVQVHSCER